MRAKKLYKCEMSYGKVEVTYYDHIFDSQEVRYYWEDYYGTVWDVTENPGITGRQVCERMKCLGNTINCPENIMLIDFIRNELKLWAYDVRKEEE